MCLGSTDTLEGPSRPGPLPTLHHKSLSTPYPVLPLLAFHLPPISTHFYHLLLTKFICPARAVDLRIRIQDITKFHSPTTFLEIKPEQLPEKEMGEEEPETRGSNKARGTIRAVFQNLWSVPLCWWVYSTGEFKSQSTTPLGERGILDSTRLFSCRKWK